MEILSVSDVTLGIVSEVKPQRLEYVAQTRRALLDAAERLYIADGYNATSIDAVAAAARFTKGAVYRHFSDKQALFLAVFEQVETETMAELESAMGGGAVSWESALQTLTRFLDASIDDRFRRIVLEEGPSVFGWARWRELDQQFTGHVLARVLTDLMDGGLIQRQSVDFLSRLCCATVAEAALAVAQSDSRSRELRNEALGTLMRMLSGLRAQDT